MYIDHETLCTHTTDIIGNDFFDILSTCNILIKKKQEKKKIIILENYYNVFAYFFVISL